MKHHVMRNHVLGNHVRWGTAVCIFGTYGTKALFV